ncbi:MAG: hypothetical protein OEW08_08750, partial [Gammaproteobacteria bacterium]|nr:hypothetical protein [Gammaproteobacteria bacterium]
MHKIGFFHVAAIVMCVFIAGCGTGAQEASKVDFFRIGGTIVGLEGAGLEIRNNNTDTLVFEKPDGRDNRDVKIPFTFPVAISNGGSYFVSVSMQPVQRRQFCAVKNGDGQVFNRDFENVEVMCSVNKFSINGKVLGLQGGGLVIQNNWTDDLGVKGAQEISLSPDNKVSGAQVDFIFPEVEGLDSFEVVVRKQPNLLRPQHCSVRHDEINPGAGKIANQSVTNVIIDCSADLYTLKGSAAFLDQSNTTLQIKSVYSTENKTEIVTVDKAGAFEFTTNLAQGSSFDVSIGTQPIGTNILLSQTCWVDGNTGHGNINATTPAVIIKCGYRVGGSVKGLMLGAHITLLNKSNGEVLPIDMDGKFTLLQPVLAGLDYEVQVEQQPTNGQRCHVTNGGGTHTMGSANVRDVTIVCGQTIGGSILGLAAGASMVLQNNSADDLTVNANGTFEFFTALPKGSGFRVSILTPPGNQPCVITYGNGIVKTYNIRSINVLCGTAPTPSGSVQAIASMGTAREGHAAIFSPGDIFGGSSILVAGGRDINGIALNSVERYDIAKNVWSSYGTMTNARSSHTMTQLWGGSIVAVGGFASSAGVKQHLASAEVYSGTYWITGGSMKMSRSGHTATALPDGTLLVVGGYNSNTKALASSELLTLGTASAWVDVGSLNVARTG